MKEWKENDMYDTNLWNCFREILEDTGLTEKEFEKINKGKLRKLRKFLRQRGVWVYNGLNLPISRALLETVAENIRSTWSESEMKDCDFEEEFTSPAIRNFLKERRRAEAAEAAKARHSRDRHDKQYSPTSSVASYRKVPSVSPMQQQPPVRKSSSQPVQHVQIPPVQVQTSPMQQIQTPQPVQQFQTPPVQQVEPPPILQVQPPVESAHAPAPVEPAPASVEPAPSAAIPQKMPKPVLSFSVISEISILPVQPSPPQQQQSSVNISPNSTYILAAIPTSAPQAKTQQSSPPTPHRATYMAASDPAFISAPILNPKIPQAAAMLTSPKISQVAVSGCTFYKKGMG